LRQSKASFYILTSIFRKKNLTFFLFLAKKTYLCNHKTYKS